MTTSRWIYLADARRRRLPRLGLLVAATVMGAAAGTLWREDAAPDQPAPPAVRAWTAPPAELRSGGTLFSQTTQPAAPFRPAHEPRPQPSAPSPISTMVAPGVHITPLSVPAGEVPVPAGPSEHDSEPEN